MENKRILLVDDEPNFAEAFSRTLEAKAYQVLTVSSRAQAQEMMKADPNIVVLGTMAPAGQAFSFYQWLKRHPGYRDIPLMVVDARPEERSIRGWRRHEGLQVEADDYISKPIEPTALVPRIQTLLERAVERIRVLVVDDHTMVRDGIRAVLALQKGIEVIGEAVNGQEAVDKVLVLSPNIVLMDIVMPVMSGLEATRRISKECPQTKVLILTQYDEEENMLVAKQAGACGFIPKRAASLELTKGIKEVFVGKHFPASFAEISKN